DTEHRLHRATIRTGLRREDASSDKRANGQRKRSHAQKELAVRDCAERIAISRTTLAKVAVADSCVCLRVEASATSRDTRESAMTYAVPIRCTSVAAPKSEIGAVVVTAIGVLSCRLVSRPASMPAPKIT